MAKTGFLASKTAFFEKKHENVWWNKKNIVTLHSQKAKGVRRWCWKALQDIKHWGMV
ncbi:MAG: hypothetical protein J6J71_00585 [Prevotella sp.]|nr:hypothetical protein [Prevotella sp.]